MPPDARCDLLLFMVSVLGPPRAYLEPSSPGDRSVAKVSRQDPQRTATEGQQAQGPLSTPRKGRCVISCNLWPANLRLRSGRRVSASRSSFLSFSLSVFPSSPVSPKSSLPLAFFRPHPPLILLSVFLPLLLKVPRKDRPFRSPVFVMIRKEKLKGLQPCSILWNTPTSSKNTVFQGPWPSSSPADPSQDLPMSPQRRTLPDWKEGSRLLKANSPYSFGSSEGWVSPFSWPSSLCCSGCISQPLKPSGPSCLALLIPSA